MVAIRQLTVVGNVIAIRREVSERPSFFSSAEHDPSNKEQASEYHPPRHQPNDPTPLTAAEARSARSEVMRASTEESNDRPNKEVPEERTVAQIRPSSQGVRSKKRHLAIATAIIGQRSYILLFYPFIYFPLRTPTSQ